MNLRTLGALLVPLVLAANLACSDAPRPVEDPGSGAAAAASGFAGRAILRGELASTTTGSLMVSVFPKGVRMPLLTMKIPLDDPRVTRTAEGERVLDFRLDESTSLIPGEVPAGVEVDLEVRFDRDGYVETKEGDVAAMVAARRGASDLVLVLPPEPPASASSTSGTRTD